MREQLSVADVLERAADLIEPEGAWAKGFYGLREDATCMCAVGAIGRAARICIPSQAEDYVDGSVSQFVAMGAVQLERWNDAPERTQAEVVAKLREAAALAREQGK